jgi:hypothetical protein
MELHIRSTRVLEFQPCDISALPLSPAKHPTLYISLALEKYFAALSVIRLLETAAFYAFSIFLLPIVSAFAAKFHHGTDRYMDSGQSVVVKEKREGLIEVSRYCPERVYLELRVPDDIHSVTRVIFRIVSHDQGKEGPFNSLTHISDLYQASAMSRTSMVELMSIHTLGL